MFLRAISENNEKDRPRQERMSVDLAAVEDEAQ